MELTNTNLKSYKHINVGHITSDRTGKRERLARCISIEISEEGKYYSVFQYILKRTLKPSGKSSCFALIIN